ncbi:MAG: hypothetical protein KAV00_05060 [Phycisphaerae bacterium]|nr:hypothetical protein [Phycisphaerae bacterium]
MKRTLVLWVAAFGLLPCVAVSADSGSKDAQKAKKDVHQWWNVDGMIRQAADNVARRYNLDKQQTEFTRKMMYERVTQFLEENEEAIWPLVRELARHQITGEAPDAAAARRIAEAALPLVEKAEDAIYKSNDEWGEILSPEQKKLHEYDLNAMKGQFIQINNNFGNWKKGNTVPNPMFPRHKPTPDEPTRPSRPKLVYQPTQPEGKWDKYVREFIQKYQLDPGQKGSAESILREMKQTAASYRSSKAKEFESVKKRFNQAVAAGDLKKRAKAERDEAALNRPLKKKMFNELKTRLNKIPTPAQKKKYEAKSKAKQGKARKPSKSKSKTTSKAPQSTKTTGK